MRRRTFLKNVTGFGLAAISSPAAELFASGLAAPRYFGLHPFIESHPGAVFIRKIIVAGKEDWDAKKRGAFSLASKIFTLRDTPGVPLTNKFAIKPNLTSAKGTGLTHEIITDPFVVEGFVDGLKGLGINAGNVYMREGLRPEQAGTGYVEMAARAGVHYGDADARTPTLKECQDGVVFRRTKYLGPFNYPDSYLINISKLKTHSMGLTLCVKNLQGTNAPPHIRFCGGIQQAIAEDFQPDAQAHVESLHARHLREGIPRWDTEKGPWMEMWIQRTLDHYSLIRPSLGLNVIDSIFAQDGDGFDGGPGADGLPQIFKTGMLIFGKDAFRVDIIGHWLGGHEPGNFGLFHIARERGVSTALNPRNIPVYLWEDEGPALTPLEKLNRTRLATPYLGRTGEPRFHMCDEPFSYPSEPASACLTGGEVPALQALGRTAAGGAASAMVFEYRLPRSGHATIEVYDALGDRIAVLARGAAARGVHAVEWDTSRAPAGLYRCRLRAEGVDRLQTVRLAG